MLPVTRAPDPSPTVQIQLSNLLNATFCITTEQEELQALKSHEVYQTAITEPGPGTAMWMLSASSSSSRAHQQITVFWLRRPPNRDQQTSTTYPRVLIVQQVPATPVLPEPPVHYNLHHVPEEFQRLFARSLKVSLRLSTSIVAPYSGLWFDQHVPDFHEFQIFKFKLFNMRYCFIDQKSGNLKKVRLLTPVMIGSAQSRKQQGQEVPKRQPQPTQSYRTLKSQRLGQTAKTVSLSSSDRLPKTELKPCWKFKNLKIQILNSKSSVKMLIKILRT